MEPHYPLDYEPNMSTASFKVIETAKILTLPNELLSKILDEALRPSIRLCKPQIAARLAPVCRRFYDIVTWHLYSQCFVQLLWRWSEYAPTCIAKFRGFGEERRVGYKLALKRFESFKAHGERVRVLTIRTETKSIGELNFPRLLPCTNVPRAFTIPFTTAFPYLKVLTINDRGDNPLPEDYVLGSLESILTTLPSLKTLNLHLQILHTESEDLKNWVESQKYHSSEQPTPLVSVARLHTLNIELGIRQNFLSHSEFGIGNWLLSALPALLQPSFDTITSFWFGVSGYLKPVVTEEFPEGTLNPLNRKLHFRNLKYFTTAGGQKTESVINAFITPESFANVQELDIRSGPLLGIDERITSFITSWFLGLKVLHLRRADTRLHELNWKFISDIKERLGSLRTITAYTKYTREQIEDDLGVEFFSQVRKFVHEHTEFTSNTTPWKVIFEF
ncbi:hypothetical protein TWF730_001541 [Orbilia blumenaviensis]|uniref:F-box domain-containing protein n=1 Tax=Orbilia blumenaviensis TaxID=1796055 RepID=A0AAV9ULJ8_9PEZI